MNDPLVPLVFTAAGVLVAAAGVIGVTLAMDVVSTRTPQPVARRTDDPDWLMRLLAEEEDWPTWYPGVDVDHLYPDCPAYRRAPHRRDLKGNAIPGVGAPTAERICGHCRHRRDREGLAASA